MAERRQALLIACEEFVDPQYKRLATPVRDARAFAKILGDPEIGQFSVELLENESRDVIVDKLEGFFEEARLDDVLLLYLAGHGDLDERHKFYFIAHDTRSTRLLGKGVADHLIHEAMARSLSKRQILILDCCYSGAISKDWASGWTSRGDASVGIKQKLTGEGRVVLTASDMLEYAYEKRSASGKVESLFTNRIIEGMEKGDADIDGDGYISVDELYSYVEERIRYEDPSQRPQKSGHVHGQLWLARAVPRPGALPRNVLDLLNYTLASARLAGIHELERLLSVDKEVLYPAASQALTKLLSDGDTNVQRVAENALRRLEAERLQPEEKERIEAERRQNEEKQRLEAEQRQRKEKERLEAERRETEAKKRLGAERRQKEKQERLEAERHQREEQEQLEAERLEKERLEAEQRERQRLDAERREKERLEAEQREKGRREVERQERERAAAKRTAPVDWIEQVERCVNAKDYAKALLLSEKAADAGSADAMYNLGILYDNGLGVAQDYGKAREWYQKAADAGNTNAMYNLGWLYQEGLGGTQDYGKVREWYQKAAHAGDAEANQALSLLHLELHFRRFFGRSLELDG